MAYFSLNDEPRRYTDIGRTINGRVNDHLADGVLNRVLEYPILSGLVEHDGRFRPYTITSRGQAIATRMDHIRRVMAEDTSGNR